jgi:tRNA threonylcarbamoyl adenosine modification protein (Sua5/YciO/YrdC/YwlC family)
MSVRSPIVLLGSDVMQPILSIIKPALLAQAVVAVPTDTIYGLAGLAQSKKAIESIYAIKGRDESKPIAICVSSVEQIPEVGRVTVPDSVLHSLLPGAVTVVFERTEALNPALNPSTNLIGIRVPDHPFTKALVDALGCPIALTSANKSGEPSTLAVTEFQSLWPHLGVVVDGGRLPQSRSGSTVVDLSRPGKYRVIRAGESYEHTLNVLHKHGIQPDETPK